MKMRAFISLWLICGSLAQADLVSGVDGKEAVLEDILTKVPYGSIVLLGEQHGNIHHQQWQLKVLQGLRAGGKKVSLGMEFFYYPDQIQVDMYREGGLKEVDFLTLIGWGSIPFEFYKPQVLFPRVSLGEQTRALNAPSFITRKVGQSGLSSLLPEERNFLPPNFNLGRNSYKKRFGEQIPHQIDPEKLDRYFAAQSIWDDTMAWKALEFLQSRPDQILVVIVGEFHVQYGGGLPDRLHQRAPQVPVLTFSLLNRDDYDEEELKKAVIPSQEYGSRADYIWF